jgi:hypothetical protein
MPPSYTGGNDALPVSLSKEDAREAAYQRAIALGERAKELSLSDWFARRLVRSQVHQWQTPLHLVSSVR